MLRKLTLTLVSCILMLLTSNLVAQQGNQCPGDLETGTTCEEACYVCDGQIDGYSNTVPPFNNPTGPNPLCGGGFVPNNTQWVAFLAGSTNFTLSIDIFNCTQGNGMQAGIISDCDDINNSEVVCSGACPGPNPIVLSATNLVPGAVYWLWFDGCAGASCDYVVEVIAGDIVVDPPGPTAPVTGPISGCPGGNIPAQFLTSAVTDASFYDWYINPPAPFSIINGGLGVQVDSWPAAGTYEICVDASNACYGPTGPTQCWEIVVTEPTPTDLGIFYYCPEDGGWPYPVNGQTYSQGGSPHEVVFQTQGGCDSSVFIYVEEYDIIQGELDTAICFGDFALIGGSPYTIPLNNTLIQLPPNITTWQGCDSSIIVNLEVVRPIIQGFTVPEGLNCTNQNIGTTVFVDSPQFGDPNATWEWDTDFGLICGANNSEIIFVCDPGWYYVTLTYSDDNGYAECIAIDSVEIVADLTLPTLSGSATTANCGQDVGSATVTVNDVMNPTILWDTNAGSQTTETATDLGPGDYWVVVTGDNGCVDSIEITVPGSPPINILPQAIDDVRCFGEANGSATVSIANGSASPTIVWTPGGQTGPTATGLAAGVYTVAVTDASGCTADTMITILQPDVLEITGVVIDNDLACNGGGDAEATASATGGTGTLNYQWDALAGNQTTATATGLTAGTYTVVVTDANGCTDQETVTITEPTEVDITDITNTDVDCNGDTNASATASANGGTGTLSYQWDALAGNQTTQTATGLGAGTYSVIVTDANGCTADTMITITEPDVLEITNISSTEILCFGDMNATATATSAGGTGTLSYQWDALAGNQTTATATGLGAGTYSVIVTDANGCTDEDMVTIDPAVLFEITSISATDLSCNGDANASATAVAAGGSGTVSYQWDALAGNQTTATATGLGAGTYSVVITDGNGCTDTDVVTIIEPPLLEIIDITATTLDCEGDADATATANGNGGTGTLSYQWDALAGNQTTQTATGLGAGTYTVVVTDDNGCTDEESVTITDPVGVSITSIDATMLDCGGDTDATATANGTGGTGTLSYQWDAAAGNQTTPTANGLGAGTYTVVVTDANGCTDEESVTITDPVAVVMDAVVLDNGLDCNGDMDASATANGLGGTGTLSYQWDAAAGNQTTQTATGLGAGTYSVTVTDANGCSDEDEIIITQPDLLEITSITGTTLACFGDADATATATGIGGTGALSYLWNAAAGNQTTATATGLGAGTFEVTVTDANGCTDTDVVTITEPPLFEITSLTATTLDCFGDADATATVVSGGGTGMVQYQWDALAGNQTTATATGLGAGTYSVIITDANGCTDTDVVTITQPPVFEITSITATDLPCFGDATASATVTPNGGSGAIQYQWDALAGNQTTATATGLGAGTYSVIVTDANGCTDEDMVTITAPTVVEITDISATEISCNGDTDATATAVGTGGTGAIGYQWDALAGNQTTATATGLGAGTYSVIITDANGCTDEETITIADPTLLELTSVDATTLACFGDADATATANAIGGTGVLSYQWDAAAANQTTVTATGLGIGTYFVTVTDENGCTDLNSVVITEPDEVVIQSVVATTLDCGGDTDAEATATVVGGTGTLSYQWDAAAGNQTTATATGLGAGTFVVVVTDQNGCSKTESVTITEPTPVVLTLTDSNDLACFGDTDGSATVEGSGGTAPYSYLWDAAAGNQPTATANNLVAGTYTVQITDALGCATDMMVTLTQPAAALAASTLATADATCNQENGEISIEVTGGTGTISYLWDANAGSQTTSIATGLGAGTYNVTITDANNCELIYSETVSTPNNFEANVATTDSVSCNGNSDGNIFLNISGGSPPYTFLWDYPATPTVQDLENIPAGTYSLTITDSDNCTITLTENVGEPAAIGTSVDATQASCGLSDASINLTVNGGTPPYSYVWDNGAPAVEDPTGLSRGTYNVTVIDANGCEHYETAIIEEPNGPSLMFSQENAECFGTNTGSITLNINGGTPPYTYDWSGGLPAPPIGNPENLPAGLYSVVVTDVNSCSIDMDITITEPSELMSTVDNIIPATCGANNGSVDVTITGGTQPYTYLWNGTIADEDPTNLPAGDYTLVATDANGCTVSAFAQVIPPDGMMFQPTVVENVTCFGLADGSINLSLMGGTPPYTYVWDPPQGNIPNPSGLTSGVYLATITDSDNCPLETSVTITQPDLLEGTAFPVAASCSNDDGEITLQIQGGTGIYSFNWTGPAGFTSGSQDLSGLAQGDYFLTITDENNCTYELMETISIPDAPTAVAATINVDCFGNSTGTIAITPNGGSGIYTYVWSGGIAGDDPIATNVAQGTYAVTITDSENCEFIVDNILISEPPLLTLTGGTTQATCNATNGTASAMPAGGTPPYTYAWSGGLPPIQNQTGLGVGTYNLTVTDGNQCTVELPFVVDSPDDVALTSDHEDVKCFGGNDGSITLALVGGSPPFTFQWDNGAGTDQNPTNLSANVYNVTITDDNGCTFVASETVIEPTEIQISLVGTTDATCNQSNGAIDIDVQGGTTGYTFVWNDANGVNVSNAEDPTGLANGTYFVTVTDANNCSMEFQQDVLTPNQPDISATIIPVTCFGDTDGAITVNVSGGAPGGFTYTWGDPQYTGNVLTNLSAGNYALTITDSDNCTFSRSFEVMSPDELLADIIIPLSSVSCNGGADATATIDNVNGGTLPYSIDWNENSLDGLFDVTGLAAGSYSFTITDGNSCEFIRTFEINEPDELLTSVSGTDANCFGVADGTIEAEPIGGTGTYQYNWSGGLDPIANPQNVAAGTYAVTITDDNGCTVVGTVTIDQPTQVQLEVETVSDYAGFNVSCAENFDGFASVVSNGGTAPYSYIWQDGTVGPMVENLGAGDFLVTVTDALGCEQEEMIALTAPQPVEVEPSLIPVRCNGDQNGMIFIEEANGGAAPYVYSIDGGDFGSGVFPSLTGGWYEIAAEDANGCTWSDSIWLPEPPPLELDLGEDIEILFGDSVTILPNASVTVGDLDTFGWSSPGIIICDNPLDETCWEILVKPQVTTPYTLMIRDENNCVAEDQINVRVKKERLVYIPSGFAPDGDPQNSVVMVYAGRGVEEVKKFFIFDRWGEMVFEAFDFLPNDPAFGWDGRLKGEKMNPQVFVYMAEVEFADGSTELFTGDVTLWR